MDYIEEIKNIIQKEKDKYSELEKNIAELKQKEEELQESLTKNGNKTLTGIMNTSKDKQLFQEISSARAELEKEYKHAIKARESKLINEVSNLTLQCRWSIQRELKGREEYARMQTLFDEMIEIDASLRKEGTKQFREFTTITKELINLGYISRFSPNNFRSFRSYLAEVPKKIERYYETGIYRSDKESK
ncbi:MAG: hypothetical protein L0J35_00180 [Tetragenococcus halophilus]|nr:hypothetical protein [Tetragenococcus halophilus]